jgi:predicted RNase H-like nuclease (RuvC/YqgF family)
MWLCTVGATIAARTKIKDMIKSYESQVRKLRYEIEERKDDNTKLRNENETILEKYLNAFNSLTNGESAVLDVRPAYHMTFYVSMIF